jgi:hypothetical protein
LQSDHHKSVARRPINRGKIGLTGKNRAKTEATSSLRALKQALRVRLRGDFRMNELKKNVRNFLFKKAAEFFGVAGQFCCCHSLDCS